ncbi:hypothetical protein K9L05_01790, partial [Candidatus Babeliales bacterium]|nr:hypothetical protein [Candidatus Babeliales bacterium]
MSIFKSKFILSSLFLCLLYPNLFGKTHTNKTFLTPRNVSQNIPLEFSTWRTQLFKTKKDKIKGSFQAATFYQKSTNKSDLGKYFGIYASTAGENRNYLNVDHSGAAKSGMTDPDALWAYYTAHLSDPSAFYPVTVANFPKT